MTRPIEIDRAARLWLIAMKGPAGSGKSTLARALSRQLGWPLIDKDDVKDLIDGRTPEAGGLAYDVMFNVARRQLLQGLCVICDSPLTFESIYHRARAIAAETGASLAIVECHCPDEDIWRERINARKALRLPAHHTVDWDTMQAARRAGPDLSGYPISPPHLVVSTLDPVDDLCRRVIAWLN